MEVNFCNKKVIISLRLPAFHGLGRAGGRADSSVLAEPAQ